MTEIRGLGYLRVQTAEIDRWRTFGYEGLGFAAGSGRWGDDAAYFRMDEREARLIALPADADRVLAVGWEVRDQFALARVESAVEKHGIAVSRRASGRRPRRSSPSTTQAERRSRCSSARSSTIRRS
jgi:3,4-dihydroxy-9,10-secoandrosta-1,3,5(10)-triene-9,17-dione 4,5-dioxygenase